MPTITPDGLRNKKKMQTSRTLLLPIFLICAFVGCLVMDAPYSAVAPGRWRAVLKLEPNFILPNEKGEPLPEKTHLKFEEVGEGELPFFFDLIYENENDFYLEIINGEERIPLRDVNFGRSKERAKDSIRINFPVYESYITALYEENVMEGFWVVPTRGNYKIPFVAKFGKNYRFTALHKKPEMDVSGKWEVHFTPEDDEEPYIAIGEFKQDGNHLAGTFMTETGDYRYLDGTVQGNKFYLSTFDGAHAFLFEAKMQTDGSLIGSFRSGKHYKATWEARRNPDFQLGDPDTLTALVDGFETLKFNFENPDGKMISPENEEYRNKIKIVQILGTWCPNCRDETRFLVDYLKKNKSPDLKVIALAFEKHRDKGKANHAIQTYKKHFGMDYEMACAGYYKKEEAVKSLPMLNHILSYPTLIFIDRNNKVRKINTGFSGPATSQYEAFKKEFDSEVKQLLAEGKETKQTIF